MLGQVKSSEAKLPMVSLQVACLSICALLQVVSLSAKADQESQLGVVSKSLPSLLAQKPSPHVQFAVELPSPPIHRVIKQDSSLWTQILSQTVNKQEGYVQIAYLLNPKEQDWNNCEVVYYADKVTYGVIDGEKILELPDPEKAAMAIFEHSPSISDASILRNAYVRHVKSSAEYSSFNSKLAYRLTDKDFLSILKHYIELQNGKLNPPSPILKTITIVVILLAIATALWIFKGWLLQLLHIPLTYFAQLAMKSTGDFLFGTPPKSSMDQVNNFFAPVLDA